jgi:hypothetical protein
MLELMLVVNKVVVVEIQSEFSVAPIGVIDSLLQTVSLDDFFPILAGICIIRMVLP